MTKEELAMNHSYIQRGHSVGKAQTHADLSIEYAIGVLEDILANVLMPGKAQRGIQDKITELNNLLKH